MIFQPSKSQLPTPEQALPGRADAILRSAVHHVNHTNIMRPFADKYDQILLGLGCFWGAEKLFWQMPGVFVTAVGYAAGYTKNPTYQEVCSGQTAHNEVVLVVYDPELVSLETLLVAFWEGHDPTQGMRQGNDAGTQYRSGIYCLTVEVDAKV
ncbi:MAG: peptide-methionine (S)-S-oxide reductase MsrA, partial [Methylococcales bacterium]|nr:peptide-methionine (S)-S-oxide reductase MsrA [Methylococcales bacterium]